MVDSISGGANVAIALQQQKLSQQIDIAVLNKVKDVQEQQGQSALKLLDSAKITQGIDVHAWTDNAKIVWNTELLTVTFGYSE